MAGHGNEVRVRLILFTGSGYVINRNQELDQTALTVGGSITLRLVSRFTSLDSAASLIQKTYSLHWSSPVLLNWRPAVQ